MLTLVLKTWDGTKAKEKNTSKLGIDLRIDLGHNECDHTAISTHPVTVLR